MFLPSSFSITSRAKLPAVDESVWYPRAPEVVSVNNEPTTIGINIGLTITVQVVGVMTAICYYRSSDTISPSGRACIWQIDHFTDVLLADVDFSGHSGVGWKVIPIPPLKVSAAHGYVAHIWFPSNGTTAPTPFTDLIFTNKGYWSEPYGFVYAVVPAGNLDYRGFQKENALILEGAWQRPVHGYQFGAYWVDVIVNAHPLPIPPDPPMILKWPIPPGWPSFENTGLSNPDILGPPEYDIARNNYDGEIIENRDLRAGLIIFYNNVTVRNCIIKNRFPSCVYIDPASSGTLIEDCVIDGYGKQNAGVCGIMIGGTEVTLRRLDVRRCQDGTSTFGHAYPVNLLIEDCFFHHLRSSPGSPHYDTMQYDGGIMNVTIRHNTLMNENGDTSAIMIDNEGGIIDNFLIEDNLLAGGGYTIYVDEQKDYPGQYPITNIRYNRNMLYTGAFGYSAISSVLMPSLRGNQFMSNGGVYDSPPPEGFALGKDIEESFFGVPWIGVQGTTIGETIDAEIGGVTLGIGFRPKVSGRIKGINFARPSFATQTTSKFGLWRFTGADLNAGAELLYSGETEGIIGGGFKYFEFDEEIAVAAGDNLVVGVFVPRGPDGKLWYFSKAGFFWPKPVPSQWTRMTAFSNNPANQVPGFAGGNGLYHYGPDLALPTDTTFYDAHYWVDPVFVAPWTDPGIVPVYGVQMQGFSGQFPVFRVGTVTPPTVLIGKATVTT